MAQHDGELPPDYDALAALPGIGRSTAGAILAQAHGLRHAILDGNVKRVLARYHGVHGHPGQSGIEKTLWEHAETHTPEQRLADYTQAIMDLGATVCTRTRPTCTTCPLAADCVAFRDGLTEQLPSPRPGKTLPLRTTVMMILRDADGRVLLERRGPQGVWSGLWSLPEADDHQNAWRIAGQLAQLDDAEPLPAFTHVFSHYKLAIEPLLFEHTAVRSRAEDSPGLRWCKPAEWSALGLPAPVRSLLGQLQPAPPQRKNA